MKGQVGRGCYYCLLLFWKQQKKILVHKLLYTLVTVLKYMEEMVQTYQENDGGPLSHWRSGKRTFWNMLYCFSVTRSTEKRWLRRWRDSLLYSMITRQWHSVAGWEGEAVAFRELGTKIMVMRRKSWWGALGKSLPQDLCRKEWEREFNNFLIV